MVAAVARRRGTAVEGVANSSSSSRRTSRRQVSVRKGNEEDTIAADKGDERLCDYIVIRIAVHLHINSSTKA